MGLSVSLVTNGRDISTGVEQSVPPGSGAAHAHKILENLARIDLPLGQDSMANTLDGLLDDEPTYFLISSNDDQGISGAFKKMLEKGMRARWVIPASATMAVRVKEDENITRWDVRTIDKATYFYPDDNS
jgi:hypothetical protein